MDCAAAIQVDILDVSEVSAESIKYLVDTVFRNISIDAKLESFRAVKVQSRTDVTLTIALARRLQKREKEIRKSLEEAFSALDRDYRLAVRFVIAKFIKQRRKSTL